LINFIFHRHFDITLTSFDNSLPCCNLIAGFGGARRWRAAAEAAGAEAVSSVINNVFMAAIFLQALAVPGVGEHLMKMLVLDHAKLDASEAAKGARGNGGGLGGSSGMLSGLLGMTAEEVLAAMVAAAVEK
jgi:hypothetical protein